MYVNDVYDFMVTDGDESLNIIKYESRNCNYKLCEMDDLVEFADWPMNKILTAGDDVYLQAHFEEMREPFKDTLNSMFTAPFYYEFTRKGIDKAKALDTVLTDLGYKSEELIAFGDSQNDKSMIQYAGIGVAMENATDELKNAADEITLSNEQDGLAEALYRHIPDLN